MPPIKHRLLHCVVCATPIAVIFESPSAAIGDSFLESTPIQESLIQDQLYCPACALSFIELSETIEHDFQNKFTDACPYDFNFGTSISREFDLKIVRQTKKKNGFNMRQTFIENLQRMIDKFNK